MLSFYVINLLIPGDPSTISLTTPAGPWSLLATPDFKEAKSAIEGAKLPKPLILPIAETYFLENETGPHVGSVPTDQAIEEMTPILIAATYATGMSVTIQRSTMGSEVSILQASEHWPRPRAIDRPSSVVSSAAEFQYLVEAFVNAWPTTGQSEKALLLIHHWLDALSCWSMEDLYLSATTLLQVIVATEAAKQLKQELKFYDGLVQAANRMGIQPLGQDFKNMRNELVHDGRLIGKRFSGPDKLACGQVVADVLNWIDEYLHAALSLGPVAKKRFKGTDLITLNAYSIS